MVDLESRLNSLRVNRLSRLDLPTPESPISTTAAGANGQSWSGIDCAVLGLVEPRVALPLNKNLKGRWLAIFRQLSSHGNLHHTRHLPWLQTVDKVDSVMVVVAE